MKHLTIFHLYPEQLNLYGDRGNVLVLLRRARWHGLDPVLVNVQPGGQVRLDQCDILFMGGGQDSEQKMVCHDFAGHRLKLFKMIKKGMVILAVCGSFQLLGRYYTAASGERIPGLGLFNFYTAAGKKRAIGDIITLSGLCTPPRTLVGFENHAGRTFLHPGLRPLGTVLKGHGNNGQDRTEGMVYRSVIGTYLHGPLLPKNPWLADYLLQKALHYRRSSLKLSTLDDTMEEQAHRFIVKRINSLFSRRGHTGLQ